MAIACNGTVPEKLLDYSHEAPGTSRSANACSARMSDYIFDKNAEDRELGRLRLIEAAVDSDTIGLLEETGVTRGWSCLELGAGAGSIVEWLGTRVGQEGSVVAVDRKTAYLRRFLVLPLPGTRWRGSCQ